MNLFLLFLGIFLVLKPGILRRGGKASSEESALFSFLTTSLVCCGVSINWLRCSSCCWRTGLSLIKLPALFEGVKASTISGFNIFRIPGLFTSSKNLVRSSRLTVLPFPVGIRASLEMPVEADPRFLLFLATTGCLRLLAPGFAYVFSQPSTFSGLSHFPVSWLKTRPRPHPASFGVTPFKQT